MDRPAEIDRGLINLERVLTGFVRTETIVITLQATQDTHPTFGQRITLHAGYSQKSRHVFEMLVEKGNRFRITVFRVMSGILFQLDQLSLGLSFGSRAFKDGPNSVEETT